MTKAVNVTKQSKQAKAEMFLELQLKHGDFRYFIFEIQ